jgi:hypothetical protein
VAILLNLRERVTGGERMIPQSQSCPAESSAETYRSYQDSSRRRFLQTAMGGTLAGLTATAGADFAAPRPVLAQSVLSPDAAL